jgi:hypothetical protein
MTDTDRQPPTHWRDMKEFEGIYLEDCFVSSWEEAEDELRICIRASLWPGHPDYTEPKPDEWTCYKDAMLVFLKKTSVSGLPAMDQVDHNIDPDGSIDYGGLNTLSLNPDGTYCLTGGFGQVSIECSGLEIQIS